MEASTRRLRNKRGGFFRRIVFVAIWAFFAIGYLNIAEAEEPNDKRYTLNIPSAEIETALFALAQATGRSLIIPSERIADARSNALKGSYTLLEALSVMLEGTSLTGGLTESGVIAISLREAIRQDDREDEVASEKVRKSLLAGVSTILFGSGAYGQDTADEARQDDARIDVITVTAQKREEDSQRVPIAMSVFTGESLALSGIDNTEALEMVTPGLTFNGGGTLGVPAIRGVNSNLQGVGTDPSTAMYIDGVYIPRFTNAVMNFMDQERVEVLKGPQVVLYGRNATAGAINLISKTPANEFGGYVNVQVGNYGLVRVGAAVDIPLVDDKLLFRGSLMRVRDDGYTANLLDPNDRGQRQDTTAGRVTLRFQPSDEFDFTLRGAFVDEDGSRNAFEPLNPSLLGSAFPEAAELRVIAADQFNHMPVEFRNISGTARWDVGWSELRSITSYTESEFGPLNYDVDGVEFGIFSVGVPGQPELGLFQNSNTFSQELTLTGQASRLEWIFGGSYLNEDGEYGGADQIAARGGIIFFPAVVETDAYAVYGSVTYNISDMFRINAGARYSYEKKRAGRTDSGPAPGPFQFETVSWEDFTPTAGIDFFPNDDILLYFKWSEGFKSGGFNTFGLASEPPVNPEQITSFEVGVKSVWFDGRLQVNASGFIYDYTDLQLQTFDPAAGFVFKNAAKADIRGIEVAVEAAPTPNLRLNAGLALLDAEFDEFPTLDPSTAPPTPISLAGNRLPLSPEVTVNVGMTYTAPVPGYGELVLRADYYYSAERFFAAENLFAADSYSLVNGRLSFVPESQIWKISVFAKNIANKDVINFHLLPGIDIVTLDPPRTYGAELEVNF